MAISRREFIRTTGAALGAVAVPGLAEPLLAKSMPTRPFGKTGWRASLYAVGTAEIPENDEAVRALEALLDGGVNYIDTAPSYTGTRSEQVIGKVMVKRRKEVFLATKTLARDADGAYAEVRESLGRLQCKQIDLLQIHAVNDMGTLDAVLRKGGAIEGLEKARKEGLIRFIGITGHTRPEVILEAIRKFPFASVLIPISALDKHISDFNDEVVPEANRRGIAIAGMKSLKGIERATGGKFEPEDYVRYAMSQRISTLTIGLRRGSEVSTNLAIARNFSPMTVSEMRSLEAASKGKADVGHLWWKRR
ncbi:MAG TPA: aldo/keto reductase [Fimbriimonadaceae bacterium]|nr:aldo/keto reductase [Fimbriimonadaceae bacterium]